jgi:hypothetical protein
MEPSFAVFFMALLLYQFYAIPVGIVFAFFLTRHLVKTRSSAQAAGMTLACTLVIFTPLVLSSQTFFSRIYAPWYLSFSISPPMPQFSLGALVVTIAVSLFSSVIALILYKN